MTRKDGLTKNLAEEQGVVGTIETRRLSALSSRSVEVSVSGLVTTMPESPQFSNCADALGRQNRSTSVNAPGAVMPSDATTPSCSHHKNE